MRKSGFCLLISLLSFAWTAAPAHSGEDVMERSVQADFAQVKQDVADAVINRGFVIDHTAHIGEMLSRTGEALGATEEIFKAAETVQFCSAVLSRKMMEAEAANIAYCPFIIFYYERADEPGTVHVGHRKLTEDGSDASKAALREINELLAEIVQEATQN